MSQKRTELNNALKIALKSREQIKASTLRLVNAAIKDRDISVRAQGNTDGISDDEILSLLQSMVKQRKDSSRIYQEGKRFDLSKREDEEIAIIEAFLPQQISETDLADLIKTIISDTGAVDIKDMGKIMARLKTQYAGQIDMGKASTLVKSLLA